MLDKLTDNMKFFIMLMVYVVYLTWWAATMNTTVEQQMVISNKTVELLDAHIQECKQKEIRGIRLEEDIKHLQGDVEHLLKMENKNGLKKGRD